ncbi:hypothetical protein ACS8FB_09480 [Psychrobacter sp. 1U1]|uniref:hypothetical protein n=1 Tax=Psychrobacter sp. 1U1 TaxID=3453576 RepID=UPI003F47F3BB
MFEKLIEELCYKEDLIDVASFGIATQSSVSKYSKGNDAQRSIDGTSTDDFAFHTGLEKSPWWEVEFERCVIPEYIIVNNRKHEKWRHHAATIEVSIINDENQKIVIHKGLLYFGVLPNSLPLILPLASKIKIRKLIISVSNWSANYLHLGSIHILDKPSRSFGNKNQLAFIVNRGDGLGERLKAILNGIVLARKTNGKFFYSWPLSFSESSFHAIDKVENIFNKSFIEEHLIERDAINRSNLKALNEIPKLNADSLTEYDGILVQQQYLVNQIKDKEYQFSNLRTEYKEAFEEIGFNEDVLMARSLAESVVLKNDVLAIHLRSGDLVYGEYRFMDRYYGKVVPLYVLDQVIKSFKRSGYDVILFGQDIDACEYVRDRHNIMFSNDLIDNTYNDIQRAMFDIILMSRCTEIICGSSGFATLSSWIGGVKVSSYKSFISEKDIKSCFNMSLKKDGILSSNRVDPLLKAFSISHYVRSFKDSLPLDEQIRLIKECIMLDRENNFYRLLLSLVYYKSGEFMEADKILIEAINYNNIYNIDWLAKTKFPKVTILSSFVEDFKVYAKQGSVAASLVVFLNDYYNKKVDTDFFSNILSNSRQDALGYGLLEKKLRDFSVKGYR